MRCLFVIFLIFMTSSCGTSEGPPPLHQLSVADESIVKQVDVPLEGPYYGLSIAIFEQQDEFDIFVANILTELNNDGGSNYPWMVDFAQELSETQVDFQNYNLLLFKTLDHYSSSIEFKTIIPRIENNVITLGVKLWIPKGLDGDANSYVYAYQIHKSVNTIHFWEGDDVNVFDNSADSAIIPKNCSQWVEGCEQCDRENDQIICTAIAQCTHNNLPFRCTRRTP